MVFQVVAAPFTKDRTWVTPNEGDSMRHLSLVTPRRALTAALFTAVLTGSVAAATPAGATPGGTPDNTRSSVTVTTNGTSTDAAVTLNVKPYENNTAVASGEPTLIGTAWNDIIDPNDNFAGEACFELHGDRIWVYDARGDGLATYGQWQNYLRNPSRTWVLYREGTCKNSLGHGHWGVCDKDFYEDSTSPNAVGGQGSGLRIAACTSKVCNGIDTWVRNNK